MFGWVSGEGGTSPLTVAEPKGNQLGEDKMLMKERKVLSFHFFFFQESTAGNRMGKELTYKRVVAFHPSPSKGLSHMPGNVKHTAAQHHSLTESGPPRTESSPKGRAVGKRARLPAWGGGGVPPWVSGASQRPLRVAPGLSPSSYSRVTSGGQNQRYLSASRTPRSRGFKKKTEI